MHSDILPILIAGGGCSGLSLAVHLLEQPGFEKEIVLVEPRRRESYTNDRTWSGFRTREHRFSGLAVNHWNKWICRSRSQESRSHSSHHPYEAVRSIDFYDHCLDILEKDPRVSLRLGCRLMDTDEGLCKIVDESSGRVETFAVAHIFDSRPAQSSDFTGTADDILLWQQFVGLEVTTETDIFDPETVTLMDFSPDQQGGIRFLYVLPFSGRHALVEATIFAKTPVSSGELTRMVEDHLRDTYGLQHWTVERSETGRIPMSTADTPTNPTPFITRIGIRGGLARPSTGYAFLAIHEHSRRIARSFGRGTKADPFRQRPVSQILDRIFLSYLARNYEDASNLFVRLGERAHSDRFARFMMDTGGMLDRLAVIMAMPKLPFILEAWRSRRIWIQRDRRPEDFNTIAFETTVRL